MSEDLKIILGMVEVLDRLMKRTPDVLGLQLSTLDGVPLLQLTGEAHGVNFSDAVLCGGNMIQEKVRIGDVNVVRFRFLEKEDRE